MSRGFRPSGNDSWASRVARWSPSLAILLVAAVIRWNNLGAGSLWLDELGQVHAARSPLGELLATVRSYAASAPLDYLATKVTLDVAGAIVGVGTLSARLWPWLCGVATVWAIERATLELTGSRRAALTAAALTALSGFLVYYSQETRFYSFSTLLTVVLVWTFARAIRLQRRRDWAVFCGAAIAGVYTHYFLALLLALEGAGLLASAGIRAARRRPTATAIVEMGRSLLPLALVGVVTVLAFVPWYLYAVRFQLSAVYSYASTALSPERLASLMATLVAAVPPTGMPGGNQWTDWLLTAAVVAFAVPGAVRLLRARPETAIAVVSLAIILVPFVWIMDNRSGYFVTERQFIFLVPILYILAAVGLDSFVSELARLARVMHPRVSPVAVGRLALAGLAIALMGLSIAPLNRVYAGDFKPKEDWRAASSFSEQMLCPGGHVYSNLSRGYAYGVGFYAPELESRAVYLARQGQNEFLADSLKRYPIASSDIIVVLVPAPGVWVPGHGTISDSLGRQGFRFHDTTDGRIRLFYNPEGCQSAPAQTLAVSGMTTPRTAGSTGSIRVTAVDAYGNRAPGYRGAVYFTSSDSRAKLPFNYTFNATDAGSHVFSGNLILRTAGTQSVTATDTLTPTITGSQTGIVVN